MTEHAPAAPAISDEWIAERWPDQDPAEVRRRFDALMDKLGETPWRGMPHFPEVMQPVLAWAAMLPRERIELLTAALAEVPEHLREQPWVATRPSWGQQSVKFENVHGDNGHGMGRQAVASTPYVKGYNLAPWIAAASPGNVAALLAELERLSASQIVPGVLKCVKCDFRLIKTTLTPSGAYADEKPDTCPNCDVPMWKVTWKDEAQEAYKVAESQMKRALEAERKLAADNTEMVQHLRQLARKQDGYGMSFSDPSPRQGGTASINLYGDRAKAAIWLFKNADRIADALECRTWV